MTARSDRTLEGKQESWLINNSQVGYICLHQLIEPVKPSSRQDCSYLIGVDWCTVKNNQTQASEHTNKHESSIV